MNVAFLEYLRIKSSDQQEVDKVADAVDLELGRSMSRRSHGVMSPQLDGRLLDSIINTDEHRACQQNSAKTSPQGLSHIFALVILLLIALQAAVELANFGGISLQEEFGGFLVSWMTHVRGFDKLLQCMSGTFVGFVRSLSNLLLHLSMEMPGLAAVECHVEDVTSTSLRLHCRNEHQVPCNWLKGFLNEAAEQLFQLRVTVELHDTWQLDARSDDKVFSVTYPEQPSSHVGLLPNLSETGYVMGLGPEKFYEMFPYHLVLDSELRVVQAGSAYPTLIPRLAVPGTRVQDVLQICHPQLPWSLDALHSIQGTATRVILATAEGLELQGGIFRTKQIARSASGGLEEGEDVLLFMGSPCFYSLDDLRAHKVFLADYPSHDSAGDVALMAEQTLVEQQRTEQANLKLKDTLAETLAAFQDRSVMSTDSPGSMVIKLLDQLVTGEEVHLRQVVAARQALLRGGNNLWQPLDLGSAFSGSPSSEVTLALEGMLGIERQETDRGHAHHHHSNHHQNHHSTHQSGSGTSASASGGSATASRPTRSGAGNATVHQQAQQQQMQQKTPFMALITNRSTSVDSMLTGGLSAAAALLSSDNQRLQSRLRGASSSEIGGFGGSSLLLGGRQGSDNGFATIFEGCDSGNFATSVGGDAPSPSAPNSRQRAEGSGGGSVAAVAAAAAAAARACSGRSSVGGGTAVTPSAHAGVAGQQQRQQSNIPPERSITGMAPDEILTHLQQQKKRPSLLSRLHRIFSCSDVAHLAPDEHLAPQPKASEVAGTSAAAATTARPRSRYAAGSSFDSPRAAPSPRNGTATAAAAGDAPASPWLVPGAAGARADSGGAAAAAASAADSDQDRGGGGSNSGSGSGAAHARSLSGAPSGSSPPSGGSPPSLSAFHRISTRLSAGIGLRPHGSVSLSTNSSLRSSNSKRKVSYGNLNNTSSSSSMVLLEPGGPDPIVAVLPSFKAASPSHRDGLSSASQPEMKEATISEVPTPTSPMSVMRAAAKSTWAASKSRRASAQGLIKADLLSQVTLKFARKSESLLVGLTAQPTDQLARVLACSDNWQFDAFLLDEASNSRPLSTLAFYLIKKADLVAKNHLHETRLARFLLRIEEGYQQDIYHSRTHAADVLRTFHVLLTRGGVLDAVVNSARAQQEQAADGCGDNQDAPAPDSSDVQTTALYKQKLLSCYLAAVVHDYEHRGLNNDFIIRSIDRLALLYNDVSPMENHHVASACMLMCEEQFCFIPGTAKKMRDSLRKDLIDLVLATDMKQHFSLTGAFNSKVASVARQNEAASRLSDTGHPTVSPSGAGGTGAGGPAPSWGGPTDAAGRNSGTRTVSTLSLPESSNVPSFGRPSMFARMSHQPPSSGGGGGGGAVAASQAPAWLRRVSPTLADAPPPAAAAAAPTRRTVEFASSTAPSATPAPTMQRRSGEHEPALPVPPAGGTFARKSMMAMPEGGSASALAPPPLPLLPMPNYARKSSFASTSGGSPIASPPMAVGSAGGGGGFLGLAPTSFERQSFKRGSGMNASSRGRSGTLSRSHSQGGMAASCVEAAEAWDAESQTVVLKMALKCADLGHLTSSKDVHMRWVKRLEEEMFRQGDAERALGLSISPLMDRSKGGITKAQSGFFNVVALPMYSSFAQVFPPAVALLDNVKSNLSMWTDLEARAKTE